MRNIRWYAFSVLVRHEVTAEKNLERQVLSIFVPRLRVTRRRAKRFETRSVGLFPRYGFIALDLQRQRWRSVNGAFGLEARNRRGTASRRGRKDAQESKSIVVPFRNESLEWRYRGDVALVPKCRRDETPSAAVTRRLHVGKPARTSENTEILFG